MAAGRGGGCADQGRKGPRKVSLPGEGDAGGEGGSPSPGVCDQVSGEKAW